MTERRSATSVPVEIIFVTCLVFVLWFFFFRPFGDEPNGGPASAEPSIGRDEQSYHLKP
jgi:hypothetical protein